MLLTADLLQHSLDQIIIISCGDTLNVDSIISIVAANRTSSQILTLSNNEKSELFTRLSEASLAQSVFVRDEDDLVSVTIHELEVALTPKVSKISFGLSCIFAPFALPSISNSQTFMVNSKGVTLPLRISGLIGKLEFTEEFSVVSSLEERSYEALFSFQQRHDLMIRRPSDFKSKIMELSLKSRIHRICSSHNK